MTFYYTKHFKYNVAIIIQKGHATCQNEVYMYAKVMCACFTSCYVSPLQAFVNPVLSI